jgi:hypothetical protein
VSAAENVIPLAVPDEDIVRLTPGEYAAVYVRSSGMTVFKSAKVRVDFHLLDHPELILSRWYRVKDYRGGRIKAGRHSDIVRELSAVFGRRVRYDRISVGALENMVVRVEVRDVIEDRKQDKLAEVNRYSVISRLVGREP